MSTAERPRFLIYNGPRYSGSHVAVLRPLDPQRSLALAGQIFEDHRLGLIVETEVWERMAQLLAAQPHQPVGFMGENYELLREDGQSAGPAEPGDIMVPFDQLLEDEYVQEIEQTRRSKSLS